MEKAALRVVLTNMEEMIKRIDLRQFLVEKSCVILEKNITKKNLLKIIGRYAHLPENNIVKM